MSLIGAICIYVYQIWERLREEMQNLLHSFFLRLAGTCSFVLALGCVEVVPEGHAEGAHRYFAPLVERIGIVVHPYQRDVVVKYVVGEDLKGKRVVQEAFPD